MKAIRLLGITLFAVCLCAGFTACSDDDDDNKINGSGGTLKTENSVTLQTAGTLSLVLGDKVQTITSLKITGPLNGDDIICLRQMLRCTDEDIDKRGMLTVLDISNSSIVEGGDQYYRTNSTSNDKIGYYMFYNCESLEQIALPNNIISINNYAFRNCSGLTGITIPESVTSLGDGAFQNCSSLEQVNFNATACATAGSSPYNAFLSCDKITTVNIGDKVTIIPDYLCYRLAGLTSITIPISVTSIGRYAFYYCSGLTSITIPNSVTSMGDHAFAYCTGLTEVTISNSIAEIDTETFGHCTGLTQVTIPESVTTIGSSAFHECTGLTVVTIPESVTEIASGAFEDCSGLMQVTIGSSVSRIGLSAFEGCSALTEINSKNPTPPTITSSTFYNIDKNNCVLNVPKGSKEAYSQANYWSAFSNINEVNF